MRAIEKQIIDVIDNALTGKPCNLWNVLSKRDTVNVKDSEIVVLLHGTDIVTIDREKMSLRLNHGGWTTVTTKSRMNAILSHLGLSTIYQKDFYWYMGVNGQPYKNGLTIKL